MREILFKAKRMDNGEWVEGFLFHCLNNGEEWCIGKEPLSANDYSEIIGEYRTWFAIDENTICQYTGLADKNGCKIWENDIVEFEDVGEEGYEYKEGFDFTNRAKVEFAEARWSLTDFISTNSSVVDEMYNHVEFMDFWQNCEVIGNFFDNQELLDR